MMRMATDNDRKELPLTRTCIERASQQERLSYGPIIEKLRKAKGLSQEKLADASWVTSRTIRNIESGAKAGQVEKLIQLFLALEVDIDGDKREAVEPFLAMIAPMLLAITPGRRLAVVTDMIPVLAEAVRRYPNVSDGPISLDDRAPCPV